MDVIQKWKLQQALSNEELSEIVQELFNGSNKKFEYEVNSPIDKIVFEFYENFIADEKSSFILRFSSQVTTKPFISNQLFTDLKPSHILKGQNIILFAYE
jgi:hypothetical protein